MLEELATWRGVKHGFHGDRIAVGVVYKPFRVSLQLLGRDDETKVVEEKELQFKLIELVGRKTADLR